ncbi:MAG: aminodeoxychorismate synthase component I [Pseudomonadota bacterium]
MKLRFDQGPAGPGTVFYAPHELIRADSASDVPVALARLDAARAAGAWLAGYCSYELGYVLEPRLTHRLPQARRLPLLNFGVYNAPWSEPEALPDGGVTRLEPRWDEDQYTSAFRQVHDAIGAGDIYQANLTFPADLDVLGASDALFSALANVQPVRHGAYVEQEDLPDLLSRSPELFFRTDPTGLIETRPMKGTQPRIEDPAEDARRSAFLASDAKNRAENLMIVDLLRNDISRISVPGTVVVPKLFQIESYATVHQMTSLVQARLRENAQLSDVLKALFPCGSITGAPKIRAMEILSELEPWPREIYCGSIGWAAPDGRSEFNVAIRTMMVDAGRAVLNVGGGVVWDSTAESEYEEALWKARFAGLLSPTSA